MSPEEKGVGDRPELADDLRDRVSLPEQHIRVPQLPDNIFRGISFS